MIVTIRLLLGTLALDLIGTGSLTGYAVFASVASSGSPSLAALVATALAGLALAVMAVSLVVRAPGDGGAIPVPLGSAMALAATGLVLNSAGSLGVIALGSEPSEPLAVALLIGGTILSVIYLVLITLGSLDEHGPRDTRCCHNLRNLEAWVKSTATLTPCSPAERCSEISPAHGLRPYPARSPR